MEESLQKAIFDVIVIIGIAALLYVVGGRAIGWIIKRLVRNSQRLSGASEVDTTKRYRTLRGLAVNVWRILVVFMAGIAIARLFFTDAQIAPLFASAGIIGVAVGFGAQSLIKDFISGLFIITENQYRVGDVIEIEGASGTVERVGTRSTVLRDVDGNVHFFPNGMVQHVINKTMGYSNARIVMSVQPSTDIAKATKIINATGKELAKEAKWSSKIIEPPQFVMVGDITSTTVELIVSGKVKPADQWSVAAELRRRLHDAFEKAGIKLGIGTNTPTVVTSKSD